MKFSLAFTAAILLLPSLIFAQSNYKPGYIVTLKGDTILGEINQKEWFGNPRSIDFRNPAASKTYTVDDIGFFEINNSSSYRRYAGTISTDQINTAKLSHGIDSGKRQDVVFLKIEQKGTAVTLYSYTDDLKTRFFIAENNTGVISELIYRIYFLPDHGAQTRSENIFISQLYTLAEKYNPTSEPLKQEIVKSNYNVSDLRSISRKINNIVIDKEKYNDASAMKFFIGAGINNTTFKPTGTFPFYGAQNKTSVFPMLSVGVNLYPNINVGRLVLRGEIQYTGASYKSNVTPYFNQPDKGTDNYSFTQHTVAIYPQIIYNLYNAKNFKFYVDAGLSFNLSSYSGNSYYNHNTDQTVDEYLILDKTWISYPVKLGLVLSKHIDVNVTYTFATSNTDTAENGSSSNNFAYTINASSIKAGINYQF